jgi:hypothetical protein
VWDNIVKNGGEGIGFTTLTNDTMILNSHHSFVDNDKFIQAS